MQWLWWWMEVIVVQVGGCWQVKFTARLPEFSDISLWNLGPRFYQLTMLLRRMLSTTMKDVLPHHATSEECSVTDSVFQLSSPLSVCCFSAVKLVTSHLFFFCIYICCLYPVLLQLCLYPVYITFRRVCVYVTLVYFCVTLRKLQFIASLLQSPTLFDVFYHKETPKFFDAPSSETLNASLNEWMWLWLIIPAMQVILMWTEHKLYIVRAVFIMDDHTVCCYKVNSLCKDLGRKWMSYNLSMNMQRTVKYVKISEWCESCCCAMHYMQARYVLLQLSQSLCLSITLMICIEYESVLSLPYILL